MPVDISSWKCLDSIFFHIIWHCSGPCSLSLCLFFFFFPPLRLVLWSTRREVGGVTVVVVVWAHLLHQLVVSAVEGDEDADHFEGFGAQPGHVALGLLLRAALRGVVGTQWVPGAFLHLFVLHPTVEQLGFFGLQGRLLLLLLVMVVVLLVRLVDLELHSLGGRNKSHGNVALTGWIVSKVDAEGAVTVIHNFACDEEVQLHCLDVRMEIAPAEHLLKFSSLDDGASFRPWSRVTGGWGVVKPFPMLLLRVRLSFVVVQIHRGEVLFAVEALRQQTANGHGLAAFIPVGLHFGFWVISQVGTWRVSARNLED